MRLLSHIISNLFIGGHKMIKTNIKSLKDIESSIREIQKTIIQMRKDKKMIAKMSIIYDIIINEKWEVDRIDSMRGKIK